MADAVNAYEATLVGDQLPGDWKWGGGVLAADIELQDASHEVAVGEHLCRHRLPTPPFGKPCFHSGVKFYHGFLHPLHYLHMHSSKNTPRTHNKRHLWGI